MPSVAVSVDTIIHLMHRLCGMNTATGRHCCTLVLSQSLTPSSFCGCFVGGRDNSILTIHQRYFVELTLEAGTRTCRRQGRQLLMLRDHSACPGSPELPWGSPRCLWAPPQAACASQYAPRCCHLFCQSTIKGPAWGVMPAKCALCALLFLLTCYLPTSQRYHSNKECAA